MRLAASSVPLASTARRIGWLVEALEAELALAPAPAAPAPAPPALGVGAGAALVEALPGRAERNEGPPPNALAEERSGERHSARDEEEPSPAAEVTRPDDCCAGRRKRTGIGAASFDEVAGTENGTLLFETSPKSVRNTLCWRVVSTVYNLKKTTK